jgi:hypothetical protein
MVRARFNALPGFLVSVHSPVFSQENGGYALFLFISIFLHRIQPTLKKLYG